MKKTLTLVLFILFFSYTSNAQGIYFRIGAGYAFPMATGTIGQKYLHSQVDDVDGTVDTYSNERISASYGAGTNFGIALGYMFNENYGVDIGIQYLIGSKFETNNIFKYSGEYFSGTITDIIITYSRSLFVNPSFVFSPVIGKIVPYGRFGVIAGSPSVFGEESYVYNINEIYTQNWKWEYKKGIAFGIQGVAGINWKLIERMSLFTEVNFSSMTYYAKQFELTQYLEDGVDELNSLTISVKKLELKKKINPSATVDTNKPSIRLREARPFSSISFQTGLRYNL